MRRISLARQHYEQVMAKKSEKKTADGNLKTGSAYERMMIQLRNDLQRLKSIQSMERKNQVKEEILPDYQAWINGILEGGKGAQDDVFMTVLVWNIDTGKYDEALQMADYALKHDLAMPDPYKRNLATVLLDDVPSAIVKKMEDTPEAIEQALSILKQTEELTKNHDAPDQARAKLYKTLAKVLIKKTGDGDITEKTRPDAIEARKYLERACELDSYGVKTELKRLEKRLGLEPATQG